MASNPTENERDAKRGALIVVEGLDRAGKSTQCARLVQTLQERGHTAKYIRFPDRTTTIGKMINEYLAGNAQIDDHSIHLLFSANRWEAAAKIEEDIANGINVIVDRYCYSGAVYSAAKDNPNLSLRWAWQPEIGLPRPDIWLFLNISPEEAAKRGGYGTERYENDKHQSRVRQLFLDLIKLGTDDDVCLVDAGQPLDKVSEDLTEHVLKCVDNIESHGPLRKFGPLP
ncbi:thymidylate kinase [Polytolypa hystricis UAMH7299]|uniref:Thymidylate kinase n=1 Tax=Polytolypa hystricis (strain UAMH7299) TaxID=1447883 RepID=A0A2B7Z168_POLH7|nr:thymidylate kinase [Polytolypa hystricis UAMH7299]